MKIEDKSIVRFPPIIFVSKHPKPDFFYISAKLYSRPKCMHNNRYDNITMFTSKFFANLIDIIETVIDSNR